MKNPLIKRLPRELKGEIGKYIVLFLFITMMIGIVSGFLVAAGSMSVAYDESFEKYNIESGNFELLQKADDDAIKKLTVHYTYLVDILTIFEKPDSAVNFFCFFVKIKIFVYLYLLLTVLYLLDSIIIGFSKIVRISTRYV